MGKVCNGPLPDSFAFNDEVKTIKQDIKKKQKELFKRGWI